MTPLAGLMSATQVTCMYTLIFLLYSLTFTSQADDGMGIDPNGRHVTTRSEEGPGICPHGGRSGTNAYASGDKGLGVDPNG